MCRERGCVTTWWCFVKCFCAMHPIWITCCPYLRDLVSPCTWKDPFISCLSGKCCRWLLLHKQLLLRFQFDDNLNENNMFLRMFTLNLYLSLPALKWIFISSAQELQKPRTAMYIFLMITALLFCYLDITNMNFWLVILTFSFFTSPNPNPELDLNESKTLDQVS